MKKVRPITILGLALSVLALVFVTVSPQAAIIAGLIGMILSVRNLMTAD